jgi:hypothetical protein
MLVCTIKSTLILAYDRNELTYGKKKLDIHEQKKKNERKKHAKE